ncbi:hypothetical protein [Streptomyces sp. Ru87]|uniref:hypothetical protein n=1 Tax=Streptomyces sp. Ru87 TaxID=2044307 RepID=UPI000BF29E50|nr:hypothetical protein [Streptomyces sp. Ru87]PGH49390.1 hypothetical protein CRI70_17760 [Streptomyces sp. Ru87]
MNTALKITAFAAALTASFGAAYGLGYAVDPVAAGTAPAAHTGHEEDRRDDDTAAGPEHGKAGHGRDGRPEAASGGLSVSEGGYTLDLATPRVPAGQKTELRFTVRDRDGRPVTAYRTEHGKQLHLILASRDLDTYRHLHPARAADGTWSTPVQPADAGDYRVLAGFRPRAEGAPPLTLGADLAVSGAYEPGEPPEPSTRAGVDGYTVTLDGALRPGAARELELTVTRDGRPVTDLQPHLGAYGHLVALRSGDLAQLHVHPNGEPGDGTTEPGPAVSFTATAPSSGTYRLFLDFKHDGKVRTAAFTVTADPADPAAGDTSQEGHDDEKDGGHRH